MTPRQQRLRVLLLWLIALCILETVIDAQHYAMRRPTHQWCGACEALTHLVVDACQDDEEEEDKICNATAVRHCRS